MNNYFVVRLRKKKKTENLVKKQLIKTEHRPKFSFFKSTLKERKNLAFHSATQKTKIIINRPKKNITNKNTKRGI